MRRQTCHKHHANFIFLISLFFQNLIKTIHPSLKTMFSTPRRATNSPQEQNYQNLNTHTATSSPLPSQIRTARQQERKSARYISNSAPQRTKVSECKHPKLPKAQQRNTTLRFLITHRHNAPFGEENKEARQQEKKSARCTSNLAI